MYNSNDDLYHANRSIVFVSKYFLYDFDLNVAIENKLCLTKKIIHNAEQIKRLMDTDKQNCQNVVPDYVFNFGEAFLAEMKVSKIYPFVVA